MRKHERLLMGETFLTSERGFSMEPLLSNKESHYIEPVKWEDCEVDDIVYCKVKGVFYTHKVWAKNNDKGLLIGNAGGHKNGWTKQVYGKVIKKR